jgi:hypothetical protein
MENKVLSLIASFIALAFVIMSYFMKNKSLYLVCQAICIIFLIASYFFTVQFFAMIGLGVGLMRTVTFFTFEKNGKKASIFFSFLFSALTLSAYLIVNVIILGDANPYDILCLVALIMYAFIFRIRNLKVVRFSMIFPTMLSILFNALTHAALFTTLTYVFELSANLVSILKYHVFGSKKDKAKA